MIVTQDFDYVLTPPMTVIKVTPLSLFSVDEVFQISPGAAS
jgi:hypothetical protein